MYSAILQSGRDTIVIHHNRKFITGTGAFESSRKLWDEVKGNPHNHHTSLDMEKPTWPTVYIRRDLLHKQ